MKNIFTALFFAAFLQPILAQQPAQYSLFMLNKYAFNPAYAGMDNSLVVTGAYRKQWAGLEGSPETQNLNAHLPLYVVGGGVGFGVENESLGSWSQTSALLTYAYQRPMGKGFLSLGLSAGLVQREIDGSKITTPEGIYDDLGNLIDLNDLILTMGKQNGAAPTVHAGLYYQGERLEVGISAANLLEKEVELATLSFKPEKTYYFLLGYRLDLGKHFLVNPSVFVKSDVRQTQIDISVLVHYNENIFAGASFRGYRPESRDAVALIGGFKLSEKISLGYAYDLTLSPLKTVSNGTHEILLTYNLGKPIGKGRPPKIIYNPRSL